MISSVDNFSAIAAYTTGITPSYTSQKQQDEEERQLLREHRESERTSTQNSSESSLNRNKQELTEEELKKVEELKKRDEEVRTHEQAHKAAAGSLSTSSASFEYQTGPDGNRYAVGGEVSIDTTKVADDPQATIEKAQQIRHAALAPAEPSGQDRRVASDAVKMEAEARKELAAQKQQEASASPTNTESVQTNFYKQVQTSFVGNNGVSMLDYFV